jgi:hypothetical protein
MTAVLHSAVIRTPEAATALISFLRRHAGEAARSGQPLQVVVSRSRETRSASANRFMWAAVLTPISQQACVAGRYFGAETWHESMKREHLPELTASGKEKWDWLPSGERVLAIGTTDLNSAEFAEYLEKVQADAATNHGVVFDRATEGEPA